MAVERKRYLAYMLRLWQAAGDGGPVWRASLESPHTGERHAFADLAALVAFLEAATREWPQDTDAAAGPWPTAERS